MKSSDEIVGPVNLGNPQEFTILQVAATVIELTGSRSGITHKPSPQDDPRQRQPVISCANELLGWKPSTRGLSRGLRFVYI